jgi:uncharacterized protein
VSVEMPENVTTEQIFVAEGFYAPDAAERRTPVRGEHIARIVSMRDDGKLLDAGGYADMSSALLLFRVPDIAEVEAFMASDVYTREGVWTHHEIRPLMRVVRTEELED